MLITLLILGGVVVLLMLAVWLSSRIFRRQIAVPVSLVPAGDGGGFADGTAFDPNVTDPGDPHDRDEPTLQESFESAPRRAHPGRASPAPGSRHALGE